MVDFLMDFYMTEDEWFDFRGIIDSELQYIGILLFKIHFLSELLEFS